MIEFGEVANLILGVAVLGYALTERARFSCLPQWRLLLSSLVALNASWVCTVLEGLVWGPTLQLVEHLLIALTALLLAVWSWKVFAVRQGDEPL